MEAGSSGLEDTTFNGNLSSDGLVRLRETLKEKLSEFLGDYSDETLVEYIIVLLKNGRRKGEAVQELKVFLEDDSCTFVSWLWDHLFSNTHLYVQPHDSFHENLVKVKSVLEAQTSVKGSSEPKALNRDFSRDTGFDKKSSIIEPKSRRLRGWDGSLGNEAETPPILGTEVGNIHLDEKRPHHEGRKKRSCSPKSFVQRKRSRHDMRQPAKELLSAHLAVGGPRRLLQFAVRDAVTSLLPSNSTLESKIFPQLRSVVSKPGGDTSTEEHSYRSRSIVGMNRNAMTTAIKAAAAAAQDVVKFRCSGNVFDRLGSEEDMTETTNLSSEDFVKLPTLDEGVYDKYCPGTEYDDFEGNVTMIEREAGLASDSASDNDGYAELDLVRHQDAEVSCGPVKKDESVKMQYSVARSADSPLQKTSANDQDPLNTSHKIVNISVNVNAWKPPHYQVPREAAPLQIKEVDNSHTPRESVVVPEKIVTKPVQEMTKAIASSHGMRPAGTLNDSQKSGSSSFGSFSAVRPVEDAMARTIFISNVHFAASKDILSRHFNKCGEVLKVIILTDPVTGQPKGSAYVEFVRKEATQLALSLNGTSFMSRILKVVRASSAQLEAASVMSRLRIVRGSPFAARIARMPLPRGIPGAFRARLSIKKGARSLQWKRGAQTAATGPSDGDGVGSTIASSSARSLTYIRNEQTPTGDTGWT